MFVPEVVQGASLIRNLRHSELFTPNGDAVNDLYELNFTVVKTDKQPHVRVFSLDGRLIAKLQNATPRGSPCDVRLGRPEQWPESCRRVST